MLLEFADLMNVIFTFISCQITIQKKEHNLSDFSLYLE